MTSEHRQGRITRWELFKHILRVQFTTNPPPIKLKGRHRDG